MKKIGDSKIENYTRSSIHFLINRLTNILKTIVDDVKSSSVFTPQPNQTSINQLDRTLRHCPSGTSGFCRLFQLSTWFTSSYYMRQLNLPSLPRAGRPTLRVASLCGLLEGAWPINTLRNQSS